MKISQALIISLLLAST
jgi:hypothetical protein